LPDYRGLPVKREVRAVTEEDVERALDLLRDQRATFVDVQRPVQAGDFVVVDYQGSCEGKPITELAPTARGLTDKKDFWLQIEPEAFIPGFSDQLLGAQAGEQRTVQVTFPADFVTPQLAGKPGQFEVTITQVKEKVAPGLDDAFAQALGAEDTTVLRDGVRRDLEHELQYSLKRSTREQIVRELLRRVQCDLPESVVAKETKTVVYDIVRENTERGITREAIDQQKDQIFSYASSSARDRVKTAFILERIAEKEGLKAEPNEVGNRILALAQQNGIKPDKLVKQLKERGGLEEIREQVVAQKALEFLEQHAAYEDVLPGSGTPA
jgi:trigger factor